MITQNSFLAALAILAVSADIAPASAQSAGISAVPIVTAAIPLNTGGVPGGMSSEQPIGIATRSPALRNVTAATLTPVLPAQGTANGLAIIVLPGGGFLSLSIEGEGFEVARSLAAHGITAFVLKYRLNPTPPDEAGYYKSLAALFAKPVTGNDSIRTPVFAVEDARAALQLVRARASDWRIDPKRVGMMGFSAGAILTMKLTLTAKPGEAPTFIAPIYGPMGHIDRPAATPPMFAALALDDQLFGHMGFGLIEDWQKAGGKAELHVFQTGRHGFGMGRLGTDTVGWIDLFYRWVENNGFLKSGSQ